MKYILLERPYCNVSPKGRNTYKSDGWAYTGDKELCSVDVNYSYWLERNENGLYFLDWTGSNKFNGDVDGNRFEVTVTDTTVTLKHIPAEGAPLFKCHTRLDGLTVKRIYKPYNVIESMR